MKISRKVDNSLSARVILTKLGITSKTVERAKKTLKELEYISREGSKAKGFWQILEVFAK